MVLDKADEEENRRHTLCSISRDFRGVQRSIKTFIAFAIGYGLTVLATPAGSCIGSINLRPATVSSSFIAFAHIIFAALRSYKFNMCILAAPTGGSFSPTYLIYTVS